MKKTEYPSINASDIVGMWQLNYVDEYLEEYEFIQFREDGLAIMLEKDEENDTFIVRCLWEKTGNALALRDIETSEITGNFLVIEFSENSLTLKIEEDDCDASTVTLKRVLDDRIVHYLSFIDQPQEK